MACAGDTGRRRGGWATVVTCAAMLALPAGSPAATVEHQTGLTQFHAASGEANRATLSLQDGRLTVEDPGAPLDVRAPCVAEGPNRATCPATASLIIHLGDGDDTASALLPASGDDAGWISLYGGEGSDDLTATGRTPNVSGGSPDGSGPDGNDRITLPLGGSASGGPGDDTLTAERIGTLIGGPGYDRLVGQDEEMDAGQCPAGMVCVTPPDPCRSAAWRNDMLEGGAGADVIEGRGGADTIVGGDGDDRIDGGGGCDLIAADQGSWRSWIPGDTEALVEMNSDPGGNDTVAGGAGDDSIAGGPGNDGIEAGSGSDRIDPGVGTDTISGGEAAARNYDMVIYSLRTQPLALSLDGLPNDGEVGEGDRIVNAESLEGGSGNDVIVGDSRSTPNPISGGYAGGNQLLGRGGDDTIVGNGGFHDLLEGGDGNDRIHALDGEPEGRGAVLDIPGMNKFLWDDRVECDGWSMPGKPAVNGNADLIVADPGDNNTPGAVRGCETVLYAQSTVTLRGGDLSVPVAAICPAGPASASCVGRIEIRLADTPPAAIPLSAARAKPRLPLIGPKSRKLASAPFKARSQRKRTVRVTLPAKTRKFVRGKGKVRAYVTFRFKPKK